MKAIGNKIIMKDKVSQFKKIYQNMKVNLFVDKKKVMELQFIKIKINIMVNGNKVKKMEMANLYN